MTDVIGFTGLKGSGKTTASTFLKEYNFKIMSLATPLKEAAQIIFNFPKAFKDQKSQYIPIWDMTIREIYQKLGTEVGRQIDPEVWIKNLQSRIDKSKCDKIAIDDVRFLNEAEFLRHQYDATIIGIVERGSDKPKTKDSHASESQMAQNWSQITDTVIQNPKKDFDLFKERVTETVNNHIEFSTNKRTRV